MEAMTSATYLSARFMLEGGGQSTSVALQQLIGYLGGRGGGKDEQEEVLSYLMRNIFEGDFLLFEPSAHAS